MGTTLEGPREGAGRLVKCSVCKHDLSMLLVGSRGYCDRCYYVIIEQNWDSEERKLSTMVPLFPAHTSQGHFMIK